MGYGIWTFRFHKKEFLYQILLLHPVPSSIILTAFTAAFVTNYASRTWRFNTTYTEACCLHSAEQVLCTSHSHVVYLFVVSLTTYQYLRLYSLEWYNKLRIMQGKGHGGMWLLLSLRYYPSICLEGLRKKQFVRIPILQADIWNTEPPNHSTVISVLSLWCLPKILLKFCIYLVSPFKLNIHTTSVSLISLSKLYVTCIHHKFLFIHYPH
jgi:hypothetical protein